MEKKCYLNKIDLSMYKSFNSDKDRLFEGSFFWRRGVNLSPTPSYFKMN